MRTAGWGVIKGSSSDPPAVASLPGAQTTEQHKHSRGLSVPGLCPPPALMCPPERSEPARGPLLDLSSLALPSCFWNPYGFQQPHILQDRKHPSLIRGWIKKCLFLFTLSFHSMPPHHCPQSFPFTFCASFSVVFCCLPSSINSFPS